MPYSSEHKSQTRARIVEAARILFNHHGFDNVTIDQIMEAAGMTRGGFYNHFKSKQELYGEAVSSFLMGRGAEWRADAGVDPRSPSPEMVMQMVKSYLSDEHMGDIDGQCPMIALPSDVARANESVREAYQGLLESMVWLFEQCIGGNDEGTRKQALTLAALCVGGMTLARSMKDSALAQEIREAALESANRVWAEEN
ncbi:MAG: TetR/AcrR family transcriptional regulator [Gammaproteobacteria bacterium]|nr:TetR/AcrR family transcriptional regulator [Gammaproteobacteria bacterium]MBL4728956.1 TetR/AcrR family transcriptional regulator [Gammaproteobacteria bacterium]